MFKKGLLFSGTPAAIIYATAEKAQRQSAVRRAQYECLPSEI
jgi:hypothetical protein